MSDAISDSSLDRVVVDLDATVGQGNTKPIPGFGDIAQSYAEWRLTCNAGTVMREPVPHVGDQWH